MAKIRIMRAIMLAMITISFYSNQVFGACRPTWSDVGATNEGSCPSSGPPNRHNYFYIDWPDQYHDNVNATAVGACGDTGVCCSPSGATLECRGTIDTPSTTDTGIFSVVLRYRGVTQGTNQNCSGGCAAVTVRTCYQVSTTTITKSHSCQRTDDDEDGYYAEVDDCDDTDPDINPGVSISEYCGGPAPLGNSDDNCDGIDDWTEACTPILVDVLGNGFNLSSLAAGVRFDLGNDGVGISLAWTAPNSDDAWLALDRNSDGRISSGSELFGNFTPQPPSPAPNGFRALAEYDRQDNGGNGDGKIDNRDAIYSSLLLWQDINHNGISEPNELHSLSSFGVLTIDLHYSEGKRRDQYGNLFRYRAKVGDTNGAHLGRWASDVCVLHR